jgi:acyl carrier protein
MTRMTVDDLRQLMNGAVGEGEFSSDADFAATTLGDQGYDSLALLELSAVIAHRFDVAVPDGALEHATTPQDAVRLVNRLIGVKHDGS